MGSRLTAFPVGRGDAFLLELDGTTILVDGGQARLGFPQMLARHPRLERIDTVVCTHADADHANGILGLLENLTVPVREVWLPGRWTDRLGDLLSMPRDFVYGLVDEVADANESQLLQFVEAATSADEPPREDSILCDGQPRLPQQPDATPDYVDDTDDDSPISIEELEKAFEASHDTSPSILDDAPAYLVSAAPLLWLHPSTIYLPSRLHMDALLLAIETAARIRNIARAAWNAGARIRWFDFEEAQRRGRPHGGERHFYPLNAVEMRRLRLTTPPTLLESIRLSLSNQESLVFMSAPDEHGCGAMFTADSDLRSCRLTSSSKYSSLVSTAPHHGAEANQRAYSEVQKAYPSSELWWVRSDANYRKRPCKEYVNQNNKLCTLCRGAPQPKQLVSLVSGGGAGWQPGPGVRACQCTRMSRPTSSR